MRNTIINTKIRCVKKVRLGALSQAVETAFAQYFNKTPVISGNDLIDNENDYDGTLVKANCIRGNGVDKFIFSDLPTYDAVTAIIDGVETSISLTANEYVLLINQKYTNIIFKLATVIVEQFSLNKYNSDLNAPSYYKLDGAYETGAICLYNGDAVTFDKIDIPSNNFISGFNFAGVSNGVDHIVRTGVIPDPTTGSTFIWGRFLRLDAITRYVGAIDIDKRYHIGVSNTGLWRLGWGAGYVNSVSDADTLPHLFEIRAGGYLYVDGVLKVDASASANSVGVADFGFGGAIRADDTVSSPSVFEMTKAIVGARTFYQDKNGKIIDDLGAYYTPEGANSKLGVTYVSASAITPTKDIFGADLVYPPSEFGACTQSEQLFKFPEEQELIDYDMIFLDAALTEYPMFTEGVANEIDFSIVTSSNKGTFTLDSYNNVVNIQFGESAVLPANQTDISGLGLTSAQVDAQLIAISQYVPTIDWDDIKLWGNSAHGTSAEVLAAIAIIEGNNNMIYETAP